MLFTSIDVNPRIEVSSLEGWGLQDPGRRRCLHRIRVEGEPLKPFYSESDDIVTLEGIELYKFRRGTVVRIMEYVNDKADRYGVWPRYMLARGYSQLKPFWPRYTWVNLSPSLTGLI
jgi:hypothetical protein